MTARDRAARFFWGWLAASTAASVLGNVTHALLDTDAGSPAIAAAVAVVPPLVLLGATHGVHALVQSRVVGAAYRAALAVTVAVALAAFVLSFAALRELAIVWAGMSPLIAWLVPVVVDLSITGSTIALLALSGAQRTEQLDADAQPEREPMTAFERGEVLREAFGAPSQVRNEVRVEVHAAAQASAQAADVHVSDSAAMPADSLAGTGYEGVTVASLLARKAAEDTARGAELAAHMPAAERIVAAGVTRIDRAKVAEVLAAHADGVAPSMIARKVSVGYSTVGRILEHHSAHTVVDAEVVNA